MVLTSCVEFKNPKTAQTPPQSGWHQTISSSFGNCAGKKSNEIIDWHYPEILVASGAHCNGTGCTLFLASDEDKGQLLQRMLTYFIRNLLVS
jgi:hypothetical protein